MEEKMEKCYEVATLVLRYYENNGDIYFRNAAISKFGSFGRTMFDSCMIKFPNAEAMQAAINCIYGPLSGRKYLVEVY